MSDGDDSVPMLQGLDDQDVLEKSDESDDKRVSEAFIPEELEDLEELEDPEAADIPLPDKSENGSVTAAEVTDYEDGGEGEGNTDLREAVKRPTNMSTRSKSTKSRRRTKQKHKLNSAYTYTTHLDPEEEKLKTDRKNAEMYEVEETRKDMSSAWLSQIKLTPVQQNHLCFSESMLIMEDNGTVVGKMYCSVTPSKWEKRKCLCVHSGSFGKFSNGLESGTSITGFVDFKLSPIQEFAHEWATFDTETIERKTFLLQEGDKMSVKITATRNGKTKENKSVSLGIRDRHHLVTEAVNILLLRFMILERRTTASMLVQSLAYTGEVFRTKYSELGVGWENVRGTQVKTWGIRRVVDNAVEQRQWDSLFNKYGRLVLRCQPDYPQALIPLWFERVEDFDTRGNFIGINSPYTWSCDAELYSKYKMKKEEITYDYRKYIMDNPEVQALLSDYLQSILFRKPQDVIEYSKKYFESFLNMGGKATRAGPRHDGATDMSSSYSYYYNTLGSSSTLENDEVDGDGEAIADDDDSVGSSGLKSDNDNGSANDDDDDGSHSPKDDDNDDGSHSPKEDDNNDGSRSPKEDDNNDGNPIPTEDDNNDGSRSPKEDDNNDGIRSPKEDDNNDGSRSPKEDDNNDGSRSPKEDDNDDGNPSPAEDLTTTASSVRWASPEIQSDEDEI